MNKASRTSFTVSRKEFQLLTKLIERAGMRRDSFLARLLAEEIKELKALKKNSDEESELVFKSFKTRCPNQIKINILLPRQLVEDINETCQEKNIRRSCFFNRFIEFVNVRCGVPLLVLMNPRKFLNMNEFNLIEILAEGSDAISEYAEWLDAQRDEGEAIYSVIDPVIYLGDFYSRELNVGPDDPRRLAEEEQDKLLDRLLDGSLEIKE